eukprot:3893539-Lingulodinium_polyedra.AAC.1
MDAQLFLGRIHRKTSCVRPRGWAQASGCTEGAKVQVMACDVSSVFKSCVDGTLHYLSVLTGGSPLTAVAS